MENGGECSGYYSGFLTGFFSALIAFILGLIYQKLLHKERALLSTSLELIAKQTENGKKLLNETIKLRQKQLNEDSENVKANNSMSNNNWRYGSSNSNRNFLDAQHRHTRGNEREEELQQYYPDIKILNNNNNNNERMNNNNNHNNNHNNNNNDNNMKFMSLRGGRGEGGEKGKLGIPLSSSSLSSTSPMSSRKRNFDKNKRKVQKFNPINDENSHDSFDDQNDQIEIEENSNEEVEEMEVDREMIARKELEELAEKYISEKERKIIVDMKKNLPPSDDLFPPFFIDDFTLLRFLRARQFNVSKATDMFRNFLVWREEYRPDLITMEEVRDEIEKRKAHVHGYDNEGRPAVVIFAGRHNPKDTDVKLFSKFIVYFFTQLTSLMKPPSEKLVIIFDYSGISRSNADIGLIKEIAPILQNSFPERIGQIFMINYPFFLKTLFGLAKPFLDPNTVEKIQFSDVGKLSALFNKRYLLKKHGGISTYEPEGYSIGLETLEPNFNL